ncbi:FecR domain-containing protein [Colwellia hornerae]|uniref:FecR domain-containing protein n=2 Tax=Colwellia hornerae TaxID=89402 RepID=A0A5C6QM75_9GAMM|nr:FecR domain-containing protein [Colwellia hornerae]TWX60329.1 FecR domain-containing protein [Colwellia hornerae]TWX70085.1 FecR domain-containing protein [Colwellia hornerae]
MTFSHGRIMNNSLFFCIILLSVTSTLQAANNAGKTIVAKGYVNAEIDQNIRNLTRRSPIFTEDIVKTGASSAAQLRMIDGGLLSISSDSQLAINHYDFNESSKEGRVAMTLLKGGLRTVTGALNKATNNYKMQTPVASIGVRGTHYQVQLLDDDLYLATWQGIIDIDVLAGSEKMHFSLGPTLAYKFAIVRADGRVEFLLTVPAVFSDGYGNDLLANLPLVANPLHFKSGKDNLLVNNEPFNSIAIDSKGSQTFVSNELQTATWAIDTGMERSGEVLFSQIEQYSVISSNGEISNLAMSMNINFNSARVTDSQLSFNDNTGEWFAAMDGVFDQGLLDLQVNFASHNDKLANGKVSGYFINEGYSILGNFTLSEILQPEVNAGGSFLLSQIR